MLKRAASMRAWSFLLFTLSCQFLLVTALFAQSPPLSFNPKPAAQALQGQMILNQTDQPGEYMLKASWQIDEYCYMYKDKFALKVTPKAKVIVGELQFIGKEISKTDPDFGQVQVYKNKVTVTALIEAQQDTSIDVTFTSQGCVEGLLCYPPDDIKETFQLTAAADSGESAKPNSPELSSKTQAATTRDAVLTQGNGQAVAHLLSQQGWLATLSLFFIAGIGMSLTACVYPMIPIISGIIASDAQSDKPLKGFALSMAYVQGLAFTYAIAGAMSAALGHNISHLLQTPLMISLSAILFVILAFSMFGVISLSLPSTFQNWLNHHSKQQRSGTLVGVFIMGIISALVVSPCIAPPLLAALAYVSTTNELLNGALLLYVLGLGLGLPLLVIGLVGSQILPKAGMWMEMVKVIFGYLLLAVSVYLVSRILPSIVTNILWILWCLTFGFSLWQPPVRVLGRSVGLILILWACFILLGISFGHNTNVSVVAPLKVITGMSGSSANIQSQVSHEADFFEVIQQADALESIIQDAPIDQIIMVDFYADWCVECQIMEQEVYASPQIQNAMKNARNIQFDVTQSTNKQLALMQRWQLFGPPATLFFINGKEINNTRAIGAVSLEDFKTLISKVKQVNL